MISGDYIENERRGKNGKTIKEKIVTSSTGVKYAVSKKLGKGGVGTAYLARRIRDDRQVVFKEYPYSEKYDLMKARATIRQNILTLMQDPVVDRNGKRLESLVQPLDKDSFIPLPASGTFGYIMDYVDTKIFLSVWKFRQPQNYPTADILCKACINLAHVFERIHFHGWAYKDINTGNIYIDNATGDVRVIDCDNISIESNKTILGTHGFVAPEVYETEMPDRFSDYFSLASLYFMIFVGGNPMDGKKTVKYLIDNNIVDDNSFDIAREIYGKNALFCFDPNNHDNDLSGLEAEQYKQRRVLWGILPSKLQDAFIQTLSTGLHNKHKRKSDREWIELFEELENNGIVQCPQCGKASFGNDSKMLKCGFCGTKLPKTKNIKINRGNDPKPETSLTTSQTATPPELSTAVFIVKRDVAPTRFEYEMARKKSSVGSDLYISLSSDWAKLVFNKSLRKLAMVNQTGSSWIVTYHGKKSDCPPGERAILEEGTVITVLRRQLQLTVKSIH